MSIYRSSVNNPVTTLLVFVAFAVFGVFSLINTSIAQFPDFDANFVVVISAYPGASASDVETNLTKTLENALNGVEDLKELSSKSKENLSVVSLEFKYGTDIESACNNVRDKLGMVSSQLPDGASNPVIMKFSMDDMPIMLLSANATTSMSGLDKILDDKIATPLARVPGVGTVSITAAPVREIQVFCDPVKLQAYGLNVSTISQIIAAENRNIPSGTIDVGNQTFALRVEKEFDDPSELLNVVLSSSNGKVVYLKDVATVIDGEAEKLQKAYTNGIRSALIAIQKQTGANTVDVLNGVKAKISELEDDLPSDIIINTVYDSSTNIKNTIKSLKDTIMITLIVVMFVVFIFLGKWRATFIIVLSIPVALLGSLAYLFATGNTLNIISMSALSIAIGMVVDDAIVVLENVSSHIDRGARIKEAAVNGTSEVAISVIASTLTMLCVFMPLTMVTGMAGIMFKQLGWIVSIIMIISTTAALTLVPMLCSQMLSTRAHTNKAYELFFTPINRGLDAISAGYAKIIAWAVTHRKSVIFGALGIFVAVLMITVPTMKTEFFPKSDQGRLSATIELAAGTEQSYTGALAEKIYNRCREEIPEIKVMSYSFGNANSDNTFASLQSNGSHIISMNMNLGSKMTRTRSTAEINTQLRNIVNSYPDIKKANITEGMGGMGGASTVNLEVFGYDFDETDRVSNEIMEALQKFPCFSQVSLSRDEYTPEYQVDFDREKLALHGLNSSVAGAAFSAAMSGSVGSLYREDGEEYDIRVRYGREFRASVEDIENILIPSATGYVKIKELGTVIESKVPPTIERKNRSRYISVSGVIADKYAMSDGVDAMKTVVNNMDVPSSVMLEIAGDYEDQKDMFKDLIMLMVLIILLVYMVMASQFESFLSPFVIMFSVPFAFTGVFLGNFVTGTPMGVMSMIGIIILLGIVVKNGIVLIDYTILMRERGKSVVDAMVIAAQSRLRPILMTTLTTVLGMLPMALGNGEGAETWGPLGTTVIWGLSISTLITLILIPAVYCVFATRQEAKKARKAAQENK